MSKELSKDTSIIGYTHSEAKDNRGLEEKKLSLRAYGDSLKESLNEEILSVNLINDELTLVIKPEKVKKVLLFLRDHTYSKYEVLTDIAGVDYPERKERFEVVYLLLSIRYNARIIVKLSVDELTPVESVTSIYNSANWFEREVYDLFGIYFTNHPDLRRLLTDYGFTGHPLRKDFPLTGYTEVRYDDTEKRVLYEPVETAQEFRNFSLVSPWASEVTGTQKPELRGAPKAGLR